MTDMHIGIIVVVVTVVMRLIFNRLTHRAESEATAGSGVLPVEFGLARWIRMLYKCGIIASVAGAVTVTIFMGQGVERNIARALFAFMGFLCLAGIIYDSRRRVIISDNTVIYRAPLGGFILTRDHIKAVYAANGHILIDSGERYRKVIPMMFEKNGLILSLLRTPRKAQQGVAGYPPQGVGSPER